MYLPIFCLITIFSLTRIEVEENRIETVIETIERTVILSIEEKTSMIPILEENNCVFVQSL